jgi:hypothetical protein
MTDPVHGDALRLLGVPADALTEPDFSGYLTDVKEMLGDTEDDRLTLLYGTCYYIARTHAWHYVTRIGDKAFSNPDPERFKQLYLERCNMRSVSPAIFGRTTIRKINSDLDDDDDLNP